MAKGFSIAALIVAVVAIFIPVFGVHISWVSLVVVTITALAGEKMFTTATAVIAALNFFVLSPVTLASFLHEPNKLLLTITIVLLIAPFVGMVLNASGIVRFNQLKNRKSQT